MEFDGREPGYNLFGPEKINISRIQFSRVAGSDWHYEGSVGEFTINVQLDPQSEWPVGVAVYGVDFAAALNPHIHHAEEFLDDLRDLLSKHRFSELANDIDSFASLADLNKYIYACEVHSLINFFISTFSKDRQVSALIEGIRIAAVDGIVAEISGTIEGSQFDRRYYSDRQKYVAIEGWP